MTLCSTSGIKSSKECECMDIKKSKELFSEHVLNLQNQITNEMKLLDLDLLIIEDNWSRKDFALKDGGGGITRAISGPVFENAGVNTSKIYGAIDPQFATQLNGDGTELFATGISLIIHPKNPRVPTVHANFRMIHQGEKVWFGGGADLTPYYPHLDDFSYFHSVWKNACAPYACYEKMKKTCDQYFTNHHRGLEMRGIGGIFFDHLSTGDIKSDFLMVKDLSNHFIKSYFPIVKKRMHEEYNPEDEEFMLYRHGRYIEFNLIHDRGTHFGLKTNGRVESILISLPHRAKFSYNYKPNVGSIHEKMMENYFAKDWA